LFFFIHPPFILSLLILNPDLLFFIRDISLCYDSITYKFLIS
jgi:hypothetical protein